MNSAVRRTPAQPRPRNAQGGDPARSAQGDTVTRSAQGGDPARSVRGGTVTRSAQGGDPARSAQGDTVTRSAQGADPARSAQGDTVTRSAQGADPARSVRGGTVASMLIVGPSWAGDMVMAQPLLMVLKQRHDCAIDVLAPAWSAPLLERMPQVRQSIDMPVGHGRLALGTRLRLGAALRGRGYDQAIVLPNSFKSALAPFRARIPLRTGYLGEHRYGLLNDIRTLDHEATPTIVQRFAALGRDTKEALPAPASLPYPALRTDPDNTQRLLQSMSLELDKPVLGLCPGAAYGPARRWPVEHFAALAGMAHERGFRIWLFGSADDAPLCNDIAARTKAPCTVLAGRISLLDAVDLAALSAALVTNDSGMMHIGAALNRPLLALYGSTPASLAPPLAKRAQALSLSLACSPCFARSCPLGHFDCMRKMSPARVFSELEKLTGAGA